MMTQEAGTDHMSLRCLLTIQPWLRVPCSILSCRPLSLVAIDRKYWLTTSKTDPKLIWTTNAYTWSAHHLSNQSFNGHFNEPRKVLWFLTVDHGICFTSRGYIKIVVFFSPLNLQCNPVFFVLANGGILKSCSSASVIFESRQVFFRKAYTYAFMH